MIAWLKGFFLDQQTFASVIGDAAGMLGTLGAFAAANPQMIDLGPWGAAAGAFAAYAGGVVSGRRTGQ